MSLRRIRIVLLSIVVVLVLIIAFQNSDDIGLSVLFWHFQVNKLAVILGLFILGGATGVIGAWISTTKKSPDKL